MAISREVYRTASVSVDELWATVGDPWRLAAWTDADRVESVAPDPLTPGGTIVTVEGGAAVAWRVMTVAPHLLEIERDTARGPFAFGWRVVRDPRGSRLIVAARLSPAGRLAGLRGVVDSPALARRLDRWSAAAVKAVRPAQ